MNLGISLNFGPISEELQLPAHFLVGVSKALPVCHVV